MSKRSKLSVAMILSLGSMYVFGHEIILDYV